MQTDISMRKDRNLSSSSVYIRTWGRRAGLGRTRCTSPFWGAAQGAGAGAGTFSFSLASAQFALATSVFSAETLL